MVRTAPALQGVGKEVCAMVNDAPPDQQRPLSVGRYVSRSTPGVKQGSWFH